MVAEEKQLKDELQTYKANIVPSMKAKVTWQHDLVFQATTPMGYDLDFDAAAQLGCKPTESLLMSLGGCMAIDIISILKKMRMEVTRFHIDLAGPSISKPSRWFSISPARIWFPNGSSAPLPSRGRNTAPFPTPFGRIWTSRSATSSMRPSRPHSLRGACNRT
jgi:hypothetical protein